ncbi:DUF1707 SHOCT-like domain-containing protein [Actinocatenispora rupis]|uniref:DUF1707 domain-containing protein n=1 Tax=Actinocatenispora rupis TaxID=519421 RepID=A0A8J3NBL9_9ACTN|nr:DUF1707 domain-containing protein [Actinocatenispora rupis]GID09494.1 hypothetical protein Aru02nite_03830 [Actinocatenispora rupis]
MNREPADSARASDADRERVADVLNLALSEGRIDFDEFEQRLDRLYPSRTYGELRALVADLPDDGAAVELRARGTKLSRSGRWTVPRAMLVDNLAGPTVLDFSTADIRTARVDVELNTRYGPTTLVLPAGAGADTSGLEVRWGTLRSKVPAEPSPGAVRFRITGRQVGGTIKIRTRRR